MFKIKNITFSFALTVLVSLLAGSCQDDFYDEISQNPDGTFGPFDLEVPIHLEKGDDKTRATFSSDELKVKNVWIALFDTKTGYVIAMNDTVFENGFDFNGNHSDPANTGNINVKLHNVLFDSKNTDAYLVGVANYTGIKAVDAKGEETTLNDALQHVTTIQEFKDICVDTGSAEQVLQQNGNAPLMSGLWGTQHGN